MRGVRSGLTAVELAGVTGCAWTPETAPATALQRLHRVAVVSTIGDTVLRTYVGVTVYNNERRLEKVGAWGLDEVYENQVAAVLRENHGLTVAQVPRDRAAFSPVNTGQKPDWAAVAP